jgi:glycerophosphoryl diester phosphodiesterase
VVEAAAMRRSAVGGLLLLLALSCSTAAPVSDGAAPASTTPGVTTPPAAATVPTDHPDAGDGGGDAGPLADAGYMKTYRNSLSVCWTDATCKRALSVAHGGEWTFNGNAYDSNAALAAAFANGADAVKIDGRITKDNVVVVSHSSPLEVYESLDCYNKKIEEMTATEVTKCHRITTPAETYQRLDDVLSAMRGKLVVQICVKVQADTAGIAAAVLAAGAEDFAFLEISTSDLQTLVPAIPNNKKLWYLINVNDAAEVDTLLGTINNPRAFMYEFDPALAVSSLVSTRLHPAGIRSFTYDKNASTAPAVKALFDASFDAVSTNANAAAVQARIQVNTARGVTPP